MEIKPKVAIIMGSRSDLVNLQEAFDTLKSFSVPFTARIISAHRTPTEAAEFASSAEREGIKVVICAAGMAAHLAGIIAAHTTLPVLGIPMANEPFNGLDALLSMVQMPPGIPVGTVTTGKTGGKNAALLAVSILALSDENLSAKMKLFRKRQEEKVREADLQLQDDIKKGNAG